MVVVVVVAAASVEPQCSCVLAGLVGLRVQPRPPVQLLACNAAPEAL